jgi:hypothetical protein
MSTAYYLWWEKLKDAFYINTCLQVQVKDRSTTEKFLQFEIIAAHFFPKTDHL